MRVKISNNCLFASIDSKGAELISLVKNSTSENYIWNGDPIYWGKHSPLLFPIVGTLKNNFYIMKKNMNYLVMDLLVTVNLKLCIILKTKLF